MVEEYDAQIKNKIWGWFLGLLVLMLLTLCGFTSTNVMQVEQSGAIIKTCG